MLINPLSMEILKILNLTISIIIEIHIKKLINKVRVIRILIPILPMGAELLILIIAHHLIRINNDSNIIQIDKTMLDKINIDSLSKILISLRSPSSISLILMHSLSLYSY